MAPQNPYPYQYHDRPPSNSSWRERRRLIRFRRRKEHLRFSEEMQLIPRTLINIMIIILCVAEGVLMTMCYNSIPEHWSITDEFGKNAGTLAVGGIVLGVWLVLSIVVFLIGYVYVDAKRRDMNAGLWVFLILVMLPGWVVMGFIFYFIAREPLPYHCPRCGTTVSARFNYCPGCKYSLHPTCTHCQREIGDVDKFCPHCGTDVPKPVTV